MLRITIDKLKNGVILILLFFAAMNFQEKFFYFVFAAVAAVALFQKRLLTPGRAVPYLCLGILMAIYNSGEGILSMFRCFGFVFFYVVGYNLTTVNSSRRFEGAGTPVEDCQKKGTSVITAIAAGSFTHYMLNYIINFGDELGRNTLDVWSGNVMAATGQAMLACIMAGLSVALFILPEKKTYRYIGIACIFLILAYNFVLAGRTLIIILLVLMMVGAVYYRIITPSISERSKTTFNVILLLMLAVVLFLLNVGGIQDIILGSNLFERFEVILFFDDTRTGRKLQFLLDAWKYPMGGMHLRKEYGYAHDLLLDGYDEYGLLGLLFLVMILVQGIGSLLRLLRNTTYGREFKMMTLCVYSAILLAFCVEPILAGMPWLMVCFCLINGCMDGMLMTHKHRGDL